MSIDFHGGSRKKLRSHKKRRSHAKRRSHKKRHCKRGGGERPKPLKDIVGQPSSDDIPPHPPQPAQQLPP